MRGRQNVGWLALAAQGAGLYLLGRWTPRFQYVAALAPRPVDRGARRCGGRARAARERHGTPIASPGSRSCWAASTPQAPSRSLWNAARPGFWAALAVAAALAHFLLCWYVLRSVASGTPWGLISIGLAVPFLVGAERLARWRETMTGATEALGFWRQAWSSSSPPPFRSNSAANGSPRPMPSNSPRSPPSPPGSIFWPCASSAGRCSPSSSCASCSIPRS